MKILGIIPARYASTRFPGKPLVIIQGKSMIQRVYEQARQSAKLSKVVVATDHEAILNHVLQFGGNVVMTKTSHRSGTERCSEVVDHLSAISENYDGVINIQGDEPFIRPSQIDQVAEILVHENSQLGTLVRKITRQDELLNENVVKVVVDKQGFALLFSRSVIPFVRGIGQQEWLNSAAFYKHIGIYGYQTTVLSEIVRLPDSDLEMTEALEQLRWLDHGYRIKTQLTEFENIAIDAPADLLKITT